MKSCVGLILAGGLSRRMGGGDKSLRPLGVSTILARVIDRLTPQVDTLLLNANGDAGRFGVALDIVPDTLPDTPGPLAGLLAGLDHVAAHFPAARFVLTAPTDCPFLPRDLAARLRQGMESCNTRAAYACSGGRSHPVVGLWKVDLREELGAALVVDDERRVGRWAGSVGAVAVEWPAMPYDPFFNVNTPEDLSEAERLVAAYPTA